MYVSGLAAAAAFDAVDFYLRDVVWVVSSVFTAGSAYALGSIPLGIRHFWANLRPWLSAARQDVPDPEQDSIRLMTRAFWYGLAVIIGLGAFSGAVGDPRYSAAGFGDLYAWMNTLRFPLFVYVVGGATGVGAIGLGVFARSLNRYELKPGFIVGGGKAALRPFNQMVWAVWLGYAVPAVLTIALFYSATNDVEGADQTQVLFGNAISIGFALFLVLPTVVAPHYMMNRWLAGRKAADIERLQRELEQTAAPPEEADAAAIQRASLRHQHLLYELQRVEAFSPTLADARFLGRFAASIALALAVNIVLPLLTAEFPA